MSTGLKILIGACFILIGIGLLVPSKVHAPDYRAKAESVARGYFREAYVEALLRTNAIFQITEVSKESLINNFDSYSTLKGRRDRPLAEFLVSTQIFTLGRSEKPQPMIVCERAFSKPGHTWFGKFSPTHAVGYSDGSTGQISPQEFARLDRRHLVPLKSLSHREEAGVNKPGEVLK